MSKVVENYKVEGVEWTNAVDKAFNKIIKKVKIDGFREGKVPRNVYEKKYGKMDLYVEASDELVHHQFHKLIDSKNYFLVAEPKVELVKLDDNGMEVNYTFFVKPEVTLGKYKNLGIKKEVAKATNKEIEERIKSMREKFAELVTVDGKVKKGNIAIIDFEGFRDGVSFEGGKGYDYSLEIGSNTFIPGFEDGIIGLGVGEEKDLELTFPDDYVADLAGAKVVFKVKIKEIKEKVLPSLDEEFFKDLNIDGVNSLDTLNSYVEKEIINDKQRNIDNKFIGEVLKIASDDMKASIEDEIYDEEVNSMYREFVERMKMQGVSEEMYFEYTKTSLDDLKKNMKEEAISRVKARYLLEKIKEVENITVDDKEVKEELKKVSDMYKMSEEDVIRALGSKDAVKKDLEMKKTLDWLMENN